MEQEEETHMDRRNFTLHLDKALSSTIDKAAWNPEKDLLAMVTKDQQLIVHRFNWQRLWAVSPEKRVTSICWRPDGKVLAVGHEDGTISLHDVENGDILRHTLTHQSAVECLAWVEEGQHVTGGADDSFFNEDRTPRFFPPPPKPPTMPGTVSTFDIPGTVGPVDDQQAAADPKSNMKSCQQRINVLCSGDRHGIICLSVFGVFPIGKVVLNELKICTVGLEKSQETDECTHRLLDAFVVKVSLTKDLRKMIVLCHGRLISNALKEGKNTRNTISGLFCMHINTALIGCRSKELHQVALQVSSIEELLDVLHTSINVMQKQWSDAIGTFSEKFDGLSVSLREHGSHGSPQDEFLSLLSCGLASSAIHQFLAGTLGEGGLKRLNKSIDNAMRELHVTISEHLQPAAEILAFRVGELQGLSRWRSRLHGIGLNEKLIEQAMEDAGMVLVQVERLLRIVSDTASQFQMFFVWLIKSLRQLNNEQSPQGDQLPAINSEIVAAFLKTHFKKDPIGPHLAAVSDGVCLDMDMEECQRLEELTMMGGFVDSTFLKNTLNKQISLLSKSCGEAFSMPSKVISPKLSCEGMLLLCELQLSVLHDMHIPISLTYYEDKKTSKAGADLSPSIYYITFQIMSQPSDLSKIGIIQGQIDAGNSFETEIANMEVTALRIHEGFTCIDLSLYKDKQLVLLLAKRGLRGKIAPVQAWLVLLQTNHLPFMKMAEKALLTGPDLLHLCESIGAVVDIGLRDGRGRILPYSDAASPLAVSASRGLACVFAGQRRALLYDLEEDEDGEDTDMN